MAKQSKQDLPIIEKTYDVYKCTFVLQASCLRQINKIKKHKIKELI